MQYIAGIPISKSNRQSLSITQSQLDDNRGRHSKVHSYHFMPAIQVREQEWQMSTDLKKEVNHLILENKQVKSQNQYYKKEIETIIKHCQDVDVPVVNHQLKVKQLLKANSQKDIEIQALKQKLNHSKSQQQEEQIQQLQQLCNLQKHKLMQQEGAEIPTNKLHLLQALEEDNIQLTRIITDLERQVKEGYNYKKNNIVLVTRINSQKNLIAQLQDEVRSFKERDSIFQQKHGQQSKHDNQINKLTQEITFLNQRIQSLEYTLEKEKLKQKQISSDYDKLMMEREEELILQRIKFEALQKSQIESQELIQYMKYQSERQFSVFRPGLQSQNSQGNIQTRDVSTPSAKQLNNSIFNRSDTQIKQMPDQKSMKEQIIQCRGIIDYEQGSV